MNSTLERNPFDNPWSTTKITLAATCEPRNTASSYCFHSGKYDGGPATLMLVGDCECEECDCAVPLMLVMPLNEAIDMLGLSAGFEAVVAASRRGFTALAEGGACGVDEKEALGVMDPVPLGVARLEGSSLVNMVAELGETR